MSEVNSAHQSKVHDLQKLLPFVHAVRCGSFIGAAAQIEVTPSAISKSIARLEQEVGVRLFNRTTRRLHLTDEGRELFDRINPLLAGIDEAVASMRDLGLEPRGVVRVSVTPTFGRYCLMPIVADFAGRFPEVELEVSFDETPPGLVEQNFDVRLQYGRGQKTSQVSRLLCEYTIVLVASPDYLARMGVPRQPADLAQHRCIGIRTASGRVVWDLVRGPATQAKAAFGSEDRCIHNPQGGLTVTGQLDTSLMAALHGAGIAPTSELVVAAYLQTGRLVRVLPDYRLDRADTSRTGKAGIFVQYPHRKHMPAKVRVFLEFLYERFGAPQAPDLAGLPPS